MIGQLPNRLRPLGRTRQLGRNRTLPYTGRRSRSRKERAIAPSSRDTGVVLFDPPRGLPTATVIVEPRTLSDLVVKGIAVWFRERWSFLRPRLIPVTVALVGLLGVVRAVDYLTHLPGTHAFEREHELEHLGETGV